MLAARGIDGEYLPEPACWWSATPHWAAACSNPTSRRVRAALGQKLGRIRTLAIALLCSVCAAYEGIVVRNASSGSDHELPSRSSPNSDGEAPQLPAGNLSHELAQLLAVSIARQQAGRSPGAATNAGLTSLANLVSATSAQRTLAPVFKDGLSALSYSQSRPKPAELVEPELDELPPDDEPMPIPSTWRQPTYGDDERWYRQQMGAALLGLAAGLTIVVPTVLWMIGWFEPYKSMPSAMSHVAAAATDLKSAEVRTMRVPVQSLEKPAEAAAQYVTGSIESRVALESGPSASEQPSASALAAKFADTRVAEARGRPDDLLAQASRRVGNGDVAAAREMLAAAEEGSQGPVSFALAETYDPNMLAAWGSRGVTADVAKAKALYRKALSLGVVNAQNRLEALK